MALAQALIDQVRSTLNDKISSAEFPYRWSDAELLRWISDAQREVVKLKPEANVLTAVHTPDEEGVYQLLDFDSCYKLIRVEANAVAGTPGAAGGATLLDQYSASNSLSGTNPTFTTPLFVPAGVDRALVGFYSISNQTSGTTLPHTVLVDGSPVTLETYVVTGGDATPVAFGVFTYPLGDSEVETEHAWTVQITSAGGIRTRTYHVYAYSGVSQADADTWYDYDAAQNPEFDDTPPLPVSVFPNANGDLVFTAVGQYRSGPAVLSIAAVDFTEWATLSPTFAALNTAYTTSDANAVEGLHTIYWDTTNALPSVAVALVLRSTAVAAPPGPATWGHVIRLVQRDVIESFAAVWLREVASLDASAYYKVWAADKHEPRGFFVYPPARVEQAMWVTYSAIPVEVTTTTDTLTLSDGYLDALRDYVMFRAYLRRSRTYSFDAAMSALERFAKQLNLSRAIIAAIAANAQRPSASGPVTA